MRATALLAMLGSSFAFAQPPDAGVAALSASECSALMEHIILLSVDESLAQDPEVKKMTPREREVTEKLARREALADPKLDELKKACPSRYDKKTAQCLNKAKTTKDVEACAK
ncbi:MAG: hypothetical protein IAE78_19265 [Myxococcus sp.]|nr:hypothetical protein [Myxococcus sp.]